MSVKFTYQSTYSFFTHFLNTFVLSRTYIPSPLKFLSELSSWIKKPIPKYPIVSHGKEIAEEERTDGLRGCVTSL